MVMIQQAETSTCSRTLGAIHGEKRDTSESRELLTMEQAFVGYKRITAILKFEETKLIS